MSSAPQNQTLSSLALQSRTIASAFFLAGIATVLSLGCVWGAFNLLTIGQQRTFGAVSYSWTLAHGHAMVFGFVGMFVIGASYHLVPLLKGVRLWKPRLAVITLPLVIVGIAIQTVAHLTVPSRNALTLAAVAAILQVVGIALYTVVMVKTCRSDGNKPELNRFIYAALVWFNIAAISNFFIFRSFEFPANRRALLFNLATFNIPYRDVQLLGIAVMMILGLSLAILPEAYGLKAISRTKMSILFWSINASIIISSVSFIWGMASGNHILLLFQWLTTVLLFGIAVSLPFQLGLFAKFAPEKLDRSLKFVRAAYLWFIVATGMLAIVPVYNFMIFPAVTGSSTTFSHAFYGAYRHALTVGFIMMMIMGMSSRIVASISKRETGDLSSLWFPFVLVNLGNLIRVATEVTTDFTPAAYPLMGISGFIEVTGLLLWSYQLIRCLRPVKQRRTTVETQPAS